MFLLKLLGIGKFLRQFFIANWKWLLPIIVVVAIFLWTKEHYYTLGTNTERAAWEARVAKESEKNAKLTDSLVNTVDKFAERVHEDHVERNSREVIRENTIRTIVEENPVYTDCRVDQEVLDAQNQIKGELK